MPGTPTKTRILAALIGAALLAPGCSTPSGRPAVAWDQPGVAMESSARRPAGTTPAAAAATAPSEGEGVWSRVLWPAGAPDAEDPAWQTVGRVALCIAIVALLLVGVGFSMGVSR